MPNEYFQFKQFTVRQDRCAMKVTTDACIFGAWIPLPVGAIRALDVGAGTGLLSLMLAQRFPQLQIDAIEIVHDAADQMRQNVAASPFPGRIKVFENDARVFAPEHRYYVLVCNPPFFATSLASPHQHRTIARHDKTLTFEELMKTMNRLSKEESTAFVLIPAARIGDWSRCCQEHGWSTVHTCFLQSHSADKKGRAFIVAKKGIAESSTSRLCTYDAPGGPLSSDVRQLMRPFYLTL